MTIDSLTLDQNTGVDNNAACNNYILGGPEPINWAYITRSGALPGAGQPAVHRHVRPARTSPRSTRTTRKDLMMNPGDRITHPHARHDAPASGSTSTDLTTGQSGSMTASVANGFGHILYKPDSDDLPRGAVRVPPRVLHRQPARQHLVGAHLQRRDVRRDRPLRELPASSTPDFNCAVPGGQDAGGLDEDDGNNFCVPGADSMLVKINGCFSDDEDFDGQSYRNDWPGTNPEPGPATRSCTRRRCCSPARWPTGTTNYSTVAFETDLPRIEASDSQDNPPFCDRTTGANCVNPPNGAQFYPFFTTTAWTTAPAPGRRAATSSRAPSTTSAAARRPSSGRC